jgi:hypothetical protein
MSSMSESARSAAKSKAERLVKSDPRARVDASGYSPEGAEDGDIQTGPRPISRRQFKRGGKVEGHAAAARADRKPRAAGGLTANSLINRDVKAANEDRAGIKHVGGMKKGGAVSRETGRTGKFGGGPMVRPGMMPRGPGTGPMPVRPMMRAHGGEVHKDAAQDRKLVKEVIHKSGCGCAKCSGGRVGRARGGPAINDGTRPVAGRLARKGGGRAKKGTNVNIIIAPQGGGQARPPMPPPGAGPMPPPGGPVGLHQGAPPPAPMGPGVMPAGAPPPMRKAGGRILEKDGGKPLNPKGYPIDVGAGGGLGRLEKAKAYG